MILQRSLKVLFLGATVFAAQAQVADSSTPSSTTTMDLTAIRQQAFARCQSAYQAPVSTPIPALDPPNDGQPGSVGLVYQEALSIKTSNLLDRQGFYVSPKPRAALSSLPMDIYVDASNKGDYQPKTWADVNVDYSSPTIQPPIDKNSLPDAGKVLSEIIIGHVSPQGDFPQLFDLRSSAYLRFAGFPPQIAGASMRLGAHRIFAQGPLDHAGAPEDFPVVRTVYTSIVDGGTARVYALVESELFCGALQMDMTMPNGNAAVTVDGYWYTREDFKWQDDPNTGLVAYSSMFWKSEQQDSNSTTDSAHDSDTMLVTTKDGQQLRYPLAPPIRDLNIQDLTPQDASTLRGWTLANEDRDPSHYADFQKNLGNTNYNFRASYDVTILESNIKTGVRLFEQATNGEYGDNIVALSAIQQDIPKAQSADQFVHFKYVTTAFYPPTTPVQASNTPDACDFLRQQIAALPDAGGDINIPAGTFECRSMIVIKKNHVNIAGAGTDRTILRLADNSPAPVLVVGDDKTIQDQPNHWVTPTRVTDIQISDLMIDGNVLNQSVQNECASGSCKNNGADIRNNALTIRGASNITVNNVVVANAISGGIVTEKYCDHIHVNNLSSYGNHFDGFAGYQTVSSLFENMNLSRNHGAGISIDIDFDNNTFSQVEISTNGDVGIFARNLHGNLFENMTIVNSGNHGVFLADAGPSDTCANDNEFRSVTVTGSKGYAVDISSACTGNRLTGDSVFAGNSMGCYYVNPNTNLVSDPTVVCN